MFRTVVIVVVAALAGCDARNFGRNGDWHWTPNMTSEPVLPKDVLFPVFEENTPIPIGPEDGVPVCGRPMRDVAVPAGTSVSFNSFSTPDDNIGSSVKECGWRFKTDPMSTVVLTCSSFYLTRRERFAVAELNTRNPKSYNFSGENRPTNLELNTNWVEVTFWYDKIWRRGFFMCTITAVNVFSTTSTIPSSTVSSTTSTPATACKCGIVNRYTRIVGGNDAQVNEYPWMVGLLVKFSRFFFCGGSLVSDRHVVTAAHCTKNHLPSQIRVLLGGYAMSSGNSIEIIVNPISIINHPNYDIGARINNDISIIEIAPLDFTDPDIHVRPICLPDSSEDYSGVMATTTGWGTLQNGGERPEILQEVDVPIVTNDYCSSRYGIKSITENMICAGTISGGTDSCLGDSGGPLIAPDGANYELIGVVSFGVGCGEPGYPGVYSRVTALQSWIESNTAGSTSCGR